MSEIKVVYWAMVARSFPTQAQLLAGNVPHTWDQDCANSGGYKAIAPFGQVPLLVIDGVVLGQSMATQRAAARIAFPPASEIEWATTDMCEYFVV